MLGPVQLPFAVQSLFLIIVSLSTKRLQLESCHLKGEGRGRGGRMQQLSSWQQEQLYHQLAVGCIRLSLQVGHKGTQ